MNVPDLRHVDFEAYERRARELHDQAIQDAIDQGLTWIAARLRGMCARKLLTPAQAC